MEILINNQNNKLKIEKKFEEKIKKALKTSLNHLDYGDDYEISISVVDEEEIRQLNKEYRGVDSVTDVLSFPLFERDEIPSEGMLGDIVICSKRVVEQAEEFGHSQEREFVYLTVHSLLHLLGYDHIEEDERTEMRNKEKEIMKKLGIFK
ncbi:rRNA maturation RNase YbeY [Helcococcus sueciensis]|uniref:rRNA maturation RNase YbeY n=1 Tax=Helcococcus sueciensis TaxID=241555 RepID=UPI0004072CC2|nr:rRNA maturation RNase YbeY [Helcococcus sueciensis]